MNAFASWSQYEKWMRRVAPWLQFFLGISVGGRSDAQENSDRG
jgi:uncharacterized membrane protein YoaK (UPF0700 family)